MHTLNFVEATAVDAVQMEGATVHSPACIESLADFQENMRLAASLSAVPAWSMIANQQWAEACTSACHEIAPGKTIEQFTQEELRRHEPLSKKKMSEIVAKNNKTLHDQMAVNTLMLEQLWTHCNPFIHSMFHSMLKLMCIQSWGGMEVLFETLIRRTVSYHAGVLNPTALSKFNEWDANPRGVKWGFRNVFSIGLFFDHVFDHNAEIAAHTKNSSVEALAAVRHVLVHKAGMPDKPFIDLVNGTVKAKPNSLLQSLFPKTDQRLVFTGPIVRALLDPALSEGYSLIRAVDRWIMRKHFSGAP